jgi:ribosomal protein S18 acetylase RimI-like enzyme
MYELRNLRAEDIPVLAEVWNECFADTPNFVEVGGTDLEGRAFSQPCFDPKGVLVAVAGVRVAGLVHFGPRTNLWSHRAARRPTPEEGHIYVLVASPSTPDLACELLVAAEKRLGLDGAKRVLLGTSWVYGAQPYYNGIAGAYEIPGLSSTWRETIGMAQKRGYLPVAEYGTPEIDMSEGALPPAFGPMAEELRARARECRLRPGTRPVESLFFPPRVSVELLHGREVVATTAYGLWPEYHRHYRRRLYGLTNVHVAPRWRGRGFGKLIVIEAVNAALREGAEGVHLHVWRGNKTAWNLYHRALGFQPKCTWLTLEKRLA